MNGSQLYERLLTQLKESAEEEYAEFNGRLLKNDKINVLGVRVPEMRRIAKGYAQCVTELLALPDDYFEVTFVKLQAAALLPYPQFIKYADDCVALINNWAACDCFAPKCIKANREDFYGYICKYLSADGEFSQRFALTTLLHFYVEEGYMDTIYGCIKRAGTNMYYVHMAAAWLLAEIIIKNYARGVEYLSRNELDIKTHNKSIAKACESYRLTEEQKQYLKTLKR